MYMYNKALHENKKRAWEHEPTWEMTNNINKIFNDKHISKQHKKLNEFLHWIWIIRHQPNLYNKLS
jgi:hypothetical protein